MTNLSEILKKYNCIPVCIDTKGGFILNVKGNYDEEELQRSFLFSDFVYTNDIPSLMNCFNDFATGSKQRLNTHFRMEFEIPISICIDGEIEEAQAIDFRVVPNAFNFVIPKGCDLKYDICNKDAENENL